MKINKKRGRSDNVEAIDRTKRLIDYADVNEGSVYVGIVDTYSTEGRAFINIGMRDKRKKGTTKEGRMVYVGYVGEVGETIKVRVIQKYQDPPQKSVQKDHLVLEQVQ